MADCPLTFVVCLFVACAALLWKLPRRCCQFAAGVTRQSLKDSVRVATVDNFQGEEATTVILSLVRNNE